MEMIERLQQMFPETDGSILSALIEQRDIVARYIAQIHDLTLAEARESVEWVLGYSASTSSSAIAAE